MLKREQRVLLDYYIECLGWHRATKDQDMKASYGAMMGALVELSKRLKIPARLFAEARGEKA
jgi:hypothetical protein